MKLLSAYTTPVAQVYVVEIVPAQGSAAAVVEVVRWGLDVNPTAARLETRLGLAQKYAGSSEPITRRFTGLEGRDL